MDNQNFEMGGSPSVPVAPAFQSVQSGNRPELVSILCGYFFVNWILYVLQFIYYIMIVRTVSFTAYFAQFDFKNYQTTLSLLLLLAMIVSVIWLWLLKKWALYLYIIVALANIVLFVTAPFFTLAMIPDLIFSSILPLAVIVVGFYYFKNLK